MGKSQTNVTNVTMHPHRQAIWGDIWKDTVEKIQRNVTNVTETGKENCQKGETQTLCPDRKYKGGKVE